MAKPLIMVVDDEVDFADSVTQIISETGKYKAISAHSAKEALAQLEKNKVMGGLFKNKIKLIVLDIKMPEMDGLQFLEKIRKEYQPNLGVIMLTAWEDEEKWDRATNEFVTNYIKKPFKKEELLKTIDRFFDREEEEMIIETFEKHIEKREEFLKPKGKEKEA